MEIVILPDADEVGRHAARAIARAVETDAEAAIGVATGSSPLAIYAELARRVREEGLDFAHASAFALDEYVGLPLDHPESYHSVIRREVTVPLGFDERRVHVPDGLAGDIEAACQAYDEAIRAAGGVDVQILGIGANGHIGFNEPGSSFASRTRIKTLAERTRADNARFFASAEEVPLHCVTQGLGTIMEAERIVLVAQGTAKADAVAAAAEGPVTAMCPGSVLQFHPRATLVVDEAAASGLRQADYYRYTFENRPEWQQLI